MTYNEDLPTAIENTETTNQREPSKIEPSSELRTDANASQAVEGRDASEILPSPPDDRNSIIQSNHPSPVQNVNTEAANAIASSDRRDLPQRQNNGDGDNEQHEQTPPEPTKASPQRRGRKRKSVIQGVKKTKRPQSAPQEEQNEPENPVNDEVNEPKEITQKSTIQNSKKKGGKRKNDTQESTRLEKTAPASPQESSHEHTAVPEEDVHEAAVSRDNDVNDNEQDTREDHDISKAGNTGPSRSKRKPREKQASFRKSKSQSAEEPTPENSQEVPDRSRSRFPPAETRRKRNKNRSTDAENTNDGRKNKPRGERVSVVVHRFTNFSNLNGLPEDEDEEEQDSTQQQDELSNDVSFTRRHKYPNRSGVNPADVLGQICRETLEKTVSSLESGISRESNSGRKAEWTRKRKAVEAFGTELEQRLFDISEILESNFVLSTRLRREKKEMAQLRHRLIELRKERNEVAIKMDEVRRKYSEEEGAMMVRYFFNLFTVIIPMKMQSANYDPYRNTILSTIPCMISN